MGKPSSNSSQTFTTILTVVTGILNVSIKF